LMAWGVCAVAQRAVEQPDAPSASRQKYLLQYPPQPRTAQATRELPDAPSYSLSNSEKFQLFVESSGSPLTFMSATVGVSAQRALGNRMYGNGVNGFYRSYGAAVATRESNVFFARYLFPTILNQDPRYHPSEKNGMLPRAFYAASRVFLTRTDKGESTFNTSYLLSTITSSTLANAYKPAYYRSFSNTSGEVLSQIGSDAGMNVLREFWPQLREGLNRFEPPPIKKIRTKIHDSFAGDSQPRDPQ
jgi:hypothetical protein